MKELEEFDRIDRTTFESLKKLPLFKGKVVTGSMEPVIKVGEHVVVEVGQKKLKRFDIIVFYQNGILVCHYIWSINKFFLPVLYQTRSLSGAKDFPINDTDYLGKVLSHSLSPRRKLRLLIS